MTRGPTRFQGQYLTYVHSYTRVHRRPPTESEITDFFGIEGPSAHGMILRLERLGYLFRVPGQPRPLRVLLPREEFPDLEGRGRRDGIDLAPWGPVFTPMRTGMARARTPVQPVSARGRELGVRQAKSSWVGGSSIRASAPWVVLRSETPSSPDSAKLRDK
jgi:hypothetical protein